MSRLDDNYKIGSLETFASHMKWLVTINIIDLKEKAKFIYFRTIGEQSEAIHEFPQTNGATAVFIKETKESLSKKRLHMYHNTTHNVMRIWSTLAVIHNRPLVMI